LGILGFSFQVVGQTTQTPPEKANIPAKTSKGAVASETAKNEHSSPIQIGFWFDIPGNTERVKVHGFRFGFPFSGTSHVSGFDFSLFGSDCVGVDGAQISIGFCNTSTKSYGFQAAVATCLNKGNFDGVQLSLFNKAEQSKGWQVGGGNVSNNVDGVQFGLTNIVNRLKGFQAGIVNVVDRISGPQIGLVNYADRGSFQLGLVNINNKSSMPFMILFNFCK
jgi:hypothetical protein